MDIHDRINKMSFDLDRLVEKAEIWQALFNECPLAVAVFNSDFKFHLINSEFTEMTGWTEEDVIGRHLHKVIPPDALKQHKKDEKAFARKPSKKSNRHGEPFILTKNGTELRVDVDLSYVIYDQRIYYSAFIRKVL